MGHRNGQKVVIRSIISPGNALWLIAKHITSPLRRLAGQIRSIEQSDMPLEATSENDYSETHELEEGIISAHKRIGLLIEEVRAHATEEENAKFEALKAQINPHFLFNTLNAIQWKASINGDAEVSDALSKLGLLLSEMYKNNDQLETIGNTMRTLEAYVTIIGVSAPYLSYYFKREMNQNLIPYINMKKVERAKELFREGYLIYQISDMLGYEDATYFSKVFKKFEGVSPEQYKKTL